MTTLLAASLEAQTMWIAIAAICIIPSVAHYAYKAWKTHQEFGLKYEMVARGMSADEIERVLAAGNRSPSSPAPNSDNRSSSGSTY